ncbi:hypothetical protein [Dyadobacter sp. OTU695]|uniref:hypothetical protein n=1 Tax=Dyadobacter sp. OTU695 TaxID=3043860 RepID=UPI00313C5DC2
MSGTPLTIMRYEARKTSWAARIAGFIRAFTRSFSDWIIVRVERSLVRDTKLIKQQMALIPDMDAEQLNNGSTFIKTMLPVLEKMEETIGKIDNATLTAAFKAYKMTIFKFEAKLHLKATEHLPVMPTDELLKEALYNASITSVTSKL